MADGRVALLNLQESDTHLHLLSEQNQRMLHDEMLQPLSEWARTELVATQVYGVRVYGHKARLNMHVDRRCTHVISSIMNIDQDAPWGLVLRSHDGTYETVYLERGQAIFYESATVLHGRPIPFQGTMFANVFVHYRPYARPDFACKSL